MDVFVFHRKGNLAFQHIGKDCLQARDDLIRVFLRNDALPPEHARVRDAARDVFHRHP
ncbi:hypothetical protein SDC9_210513 [bioreactor metagenome]|uniref:Uncharacterized protein n=1 Tax=bioreactor metagenome TaxID=1076179 RepID=A0A645JI26_9ZZZZ